MPVDEKCEKFEKCQRYVPSLGVMISTSKKDTSMRQCIILSFLYYRFSFLLLFVFEHVGLANSFLISLKSKMVHSQIIRIRIKRKGNATRPLKTDKKIAWTKPRLDAGFGPCGERREASALGFSGRFYSWED